MINVNPHRTITHLISRIMNLPTAYKPIEKTPQMADTALEELAVYLKTDLYDFDISILANAITFYRKLNCNKVFEEEMGTYFSERFGKDTWYKHLAKLELIRTSYYEPIKKKTMNELKMHPSISDMIRHITDRSDKEYKHLHWLEKPMSDKYALKDISATLVQGMTLADFDISYIINAGYFFRHFKCNKPFVLEMYKYFSDRFGSNTWNKWLTDNNMKDQTKEKTMKRHESIDILFKDISENIGGKHPYDNEEEMLKLCEKLDKKSLTNFDVFKIKNAELFYRYLGESKTHSMDISEYFSKVFGPDVWIKQIHTVEYIMQHSNELSGLKKPINNDHTLDELEKKEFQLLLLNTLMTEYRNRPILAQWSKDVWSVVQSLK
jgi:hypothetical protein